MSCCGGVDVVEDVRISPTIKKVVRDIYYRDKNYIDVCGKIAARNFEQNTVGLLGRENYYKIPGHNMYVLTDNGRPDGKIIEISKLHGDVLDIKYLVRENKELYGNIAKKLVRMPNGENKVVLSGAMSSLHNNNTLKFMFNAYSVKQTVISCLDRICKQSIIDIRTNRVSWCNATYKDANNSIDLVRMKHVLKRENNQDLEREESSFAGIQDSNQLITLQFVDNSYKPSVAFYSRVSGDDYYDIKLIPQPKPQRNEGNEERIRVLSPSMSTEELCLTFNIHGISGFFDEQGVRRTLQNNTDVYTFDKQLRAVMGLEGDVENNQSYYQTYRFFLKIYGLEEKVRKAVEAHEMEERLKERLNSKSREFQRDRAKGVITMGTKRNIKNKPPRDNRSEGRNQNVLTLKQNNKHKKVSNLANREIINQENINGVVNRNRGNDLGSSY